MVGIKHSLTGHHTASPLGPSSVVASHARGFASRATGGAAGAQKVFVGRKPRKAPATQRLSALSSPEVEIEPIDEAPVTTNIITAAYDGSAIRVMEGLEAVRKRPGMYIGNTGVEGLHHLVSELVDNSIDEVMAGHATWVRVDADVDSRWVTVEDDGRGIPTDEVPGRPGESALTVVACQLHAGGKFGDAGYRASGGLHGVGLSCVNALSERMEVTVFRGGEEFNQVFAKGKPLGPVTRAKAADASLKGTRVRFLFDRTIFKHEGLAFKPQIISERLRELAYLNRGTAISFRFSDKSQRGKPGSAEGQWSEYRFAGGIKELVRDLVNGTHAVPKSADPLAGSAATGRNGTSSSSSSSDSPSSSSSASSSSRPPLHPEPIYSSREVEGVGVEVALQWTQSVVPGDTLVLGYTNSIRNKDGGSHCDAVTGRALTRALNRLIKAREALQKVKTRGDAAGVRRARGAAAAGAASAADTDIEGRFLRAGLVAAVSVRVVEPQFEGQTKGRLASAEARRAVDKVLEENLARALELRPEVLDAVTGQARMVQEADEAARKARENARERRTQSRSSLPGKLVDCTTKDPERAEIFIVEGDSAGGSAKMGRDREFQAVLPLRGKILNIEKAVDVTVTKNREIAALITALGLGERGEAIDKRLRYGKIIMLTDADIDGAHIRTLLLTFLFRYKRELFERGLVYVGVPPLYRVECPTSWRLLPKYCYDEGELKVYLGAIQQQQGAAAGAAGQPQPGAGAGGAPRGVTIQRFKGLGEMNGDQLWETTMDPARRHLRRLSVADLEAADRMISALMGAEVGPRRAMIEEYGTAFRAEDLDI